MFDKEQLIEMQWVARNRKRYQGLGYIYTRTFDVFTVKAADLPKGSEKYVEVICDYCGKPYQQQYKHQYHHAGKDCCKKCWHNKMSETMIEQYGTANPLQNPDFVKKYEDTCMKRFGCKKHLASKEIKEKILNSYYKNGTCPTSSQQISIRDMLRDTYGNCDMNVPCGASSLLDCVVIIKGVKVDVEYDGSYWHEDAQKDRRRDEFVKSQGYKVLRIKSRRSVPTQEQLKEKIDYLVKDNHSYAELDLDI